MNDLTVRVTPGIQARINAYTCATANMVTAALAMGTLPDSANNDTQVAMDQYLMSHNALRELLQASIPPMSFHVGVVDVRATVEGYIDQVRRTGIAYQLKVVTVHPHFTAHATGVVLPA